MSSDPQPLGWQYYLHNAFLTAASPLLAGHWAWRRLVKGKSREGLEERLGRYPEPVTRLKQTGDPILWVHAVSVGEVAAAASILAEVRKEAPIARLVLSTTTPTGRDLAEKRDLNLDALIYFPLDLPWVVRRALEAIRPDLLVTVDTELWPNLFALARERGVKVAVANARFSDGSFRRARLIRGYYRWMLGNVNAVLAQSQVDAERYIALGADPSRVEVTGNVKFDEDFPEVSPAERERLRHELGLAPGIPIWVVGSTREGEEALMLDAFARLRLAHHDLQLVMAPRHPERGEEVARLVSDRGYHALRRTELIAAAQTGGPRPTAADRPEDTVVILDTIGELAKVYALADVVTVGGSFVKWGGHNMLQPMAQGKPVIFGPQTRNFRDIVTVCLNAEAAVQLSGADELADAVGDILSSPATAELLSARARRVVQTNQGASARTASRLVELLKSATSQAV